MYIFLCDETNIKPSQDVKFFIYGGLLFQIEQIRQLDESIAAIRKEAGFRKGDEFKFNTATRPSYVSPEQHAIAKDKVVLKCRELECRFIVHVIHHGVIKNQELDQQVEWAANLVIGRFHSFLLEKNDYGICILDNLPIRKQFKYLSEKYCHGLILPRGIEIPLPRIKLFATTCINASNISSAMDIVLGCFRYCINNPPNIKAAKKMMANVIELMWHHKKDDAYHVVERGLIVKPPLIRLKRDYPVFVNDYNELFKLINTLLVDV
jgi:hypothetical protein